MLVRPMARGTPKRRNRKPPSRALAEVRQAALIEATIQSLAARGLGAVSVRDVAARAGVSPGLLRHHFGSFANLLVAAYRAVVARVDTVIDGAIADAGSDPEKRMQAFLDASFRPSIVDPDLLAAWLGFWGLVKSEKLAARVHAESFAAYRMRVEHLFRDLAKSRGVKVDARMAALGLSAMLDGLWLELCLDPTSFTPDEAVKLARDWVEGLLSKSPPPRLARE